MLPFSGAVGRTTKKLSILAFRITEPFRFPPKLWLLRTFLFNDLNLSLRHDLIALPGRVVSRRGGQREITSLYYANGRRADDTNIVLTTPGHPKFPKEYRFAPEHIDVPSDLDVVDHEVLYLGVAHNHYGHFLLESMSRMWAALETKLPCVFLGTKELIDRGDEYFSKIMNSMNFTVLSPDRPTLYRKIWVPDSTLIMDQIHSQADGVHLRVTESLLKRRRKTWDQPVFLSRRGLLSQARTYLTTDVADEERLEGSLERAGYRIVAPQALPFADQIALFNECPKIVGLIGSAFHTAFFSRRSYSGKLALLTFPANITPYHLIDSIKGYSATYIECSVVDVSNKTMNIDVEKALERLIDDGFVD